MCSGFSLLTTPTKVECEEDIHMASLISQKFHIKVVRPLSELKENSVAQALLRFTQILTKIMQFIVSYVFPKIFKSTF